MHRHPLLLTLLVFVGAVDFAGNAFADGVITIGGRSVTVFTPAGYDPGVPTPVVMLLHGFTTNGLTQESYMQFSELQDEFGFLYLHPDGTLNSDPTTPVRFWNATDACCDIYGDDPDDSGYLRAVLDQMQIDFNVDTSRVFIIGHSNGGFMAYRMACDHADLVAAVVSLAGATYDTPADCTPSEPVHTLQIHGTADTTIGYTGGTAVGGLPYPGAVETTETWATYDQCSLTSLGAPALDLDSSLAGNETTVSRYATECSAGGSAELWTIVSGAHSPTLSPDFNDEVIEFLFDHPKPAVVPALSPAAGALLALLVASAGGLAIRSSRSRPG